MSTPTPPTKLSGSKRPLDEIIDLTTDGKPPAKAKKHTKANEATSSKQETKADGATQCPLCLTMDPDTIKSRDEIETMILLKRCKYVHAALHTLAEYQDCGMGEWILPPATIHTPKQRSIAARAIVSAADEIYKASPYRFLCYDRAGTCFVCDTRFGDKTCKKRAAFKRACASGTDEVKSILERYESSIVLPASTTTLHLRISDGWARLRNDICMTAGWFYADCVCGGAGQKTFHPRTPDVLLCGQDPSLESNGNGWTRHLHGPDRRILAHLVARCIDQHLCPEFRRESQKMFHPLTPDLLLSKRYETVANRLSAWIIDNAVGIIDPSLVLIDRSGDAEHDSRLYFYAKGWAHPFDAVLKPQETYARSMDGSAPSIRILKTPDDNLHVFGDEWCATGKAEPTDLHTIRVYKLLPENAMIRTIPPGARRLPPVLTDQGANLAARKSWQFLYVHDVGARTSEFAIPEDATDDIDHSERLELYEKYAHAMSAKCAEHTGVFITSNGKDDVVANKILSFLGGATKVVPNRKIFCAYCRTSKPCGVDLAKLRRDIRDKQARFLLNGIHHVIAKTAGVCHKWVFNKVMEAFYKFGYIGRIQRHATFQCTCTSCPQSYE